MLHCSIIIDKNKNVINLGHLLPYGNTVNRRWRLLVVPIPAFVGWVSRSFPGPAKVMHSTSHRPAPRWSSLSPATEKIAHMNKIRCFTSLAIALMTNSAIAQSTPQDWESEVKKFDNGYWQAYNDCNIEKLAQLNTDDLEFYHDLGGVMIGKAKFVAAMKNNICASPDRKVRREAIAESIRIYPLKSNGNLYGSIISGEHRFYNSEKGKAEHLSGRARFTHVLLLKDGAWSVSRVLSFDHSSVQHENKQAAVKLDASVLDQRAGNYIAKDKSVIVVTRVDDYLSANAGGRTFTLYPTDGNNFFIKDREITVEFSRVDGGKGQRLIVRERGAIVADAATQD